MSNRQELMNKTLILTQTDPETDMMFNNWIRSGFHADILFKDIPKPLRLMRRIAINSTLPSYSMYKCWLKDSWVKDIKNYDIFIVHAGDWTRNIAGFIHSINKNARIIYWYWNLVNDLSSPTKVRDDKVEYWTFDKNDAQKYDMNLNIQYYTPIHIAQLNPEYDIYYVGHDHGRSKKINNFKKVAVNKGLKIKLDLIPDNGKLIPYSEVCKRISKSKAILEINQISQIGYTLRTMESLFFEKKLITDNLAAKDLKFYNSNNIFIWNTKNNDNLLEFMQRPYDNSVNKYKKEYDVYAWFNNFFTLDN